MQTLWFSFFIFHSSLFACFSRHSVNQISSISTKKHAKKERFFTTPFLGVVKRPVFCAFITTTKAETTHFFGLVVYLLLTRGEI